MPTMVRVSGTAAGGMGAQYRKVLTYANKATGSYVLNDTNFSGLGAFLPGWVTIASGTPANVTVEVTSDGGTTWRSTGTAGGSYFVDDAGTVRITIATAATTIYLLPVTP